METAKQNFSDLLIKHSITEEQQDVELGIKERIHKIFNNLIKQCCDKHEGLDAEFAERFLQAVELKDPSVLDRSDMVSAVASILYDDAGDLDIQDGENVQPKHKFTMQFIKVLSSKNRESTVHIFDALLNFFLPDSVHRKDYLHLLVYSDCWTALDALKMAHRCCSMTVDEGTKLLHKAKTYGVEFGKTYGCLSEESPLDALTKVIKGDGDKSLVLVLNEMRKAGVPEELLNKVEAIVSKVYHLFVSL